MDGLRPYKAAMCNLGCEDKQETGRYVNNRAENTHLPFRRGERAMLCVRQIRSLQKFASVHATFHNPFDSERHLVDRDIYKTRRTALLTEWQNLMDRRMSQEGCTLHNGERFASD